MLSHTFTRVEEHTAQHINERNRRFIDASIEHHRYAGPEAIHKRLEELEAEWDIERALEANAAGISLAGLALGTFVDRRWFLLPATVAGFLMMHALQGWCPPVPIMRRLGVRTAREIQSEACALRALQGEFDYLTEEGRIPPQRSSSMNTITGQVPI